MSTPMFLYRLCTPARITRLGPEKSVIVRLSAPIKSRFAEEYHLDYAKLLSDSDYKET